MTRPSPTKVLAVHPSGELYGSDRVLLESVDAFRERGWAVDVTLPTPGPLVDELERRGAVVEIVRSPILRKAYLRGFGPLRLLVETLRAVPVGLRFLRRSRPHVIYVSTLTAPLWLPLARLLRIPVVAHVHEAEEAASRPVRVALAAPLLLAHRIVTNSRFSTGVLASAIPAVGRRSTVIYNGVPGPSAPVAPRERLEPPVRLLYLGRISERKGVLDLVDAVIELTERGTPVVLDVVGAVFPGYEWVDEEVRSRVAASGLEDRVVLHGFDTDVWGHLARADIMIVPSQMAEPFGNTAVEGALAARPVIASAAGGLVEATDGTRSSLGVPPGSPAAIADAVERQVANWAEVRSWAIDDAARAEARFAPAVYRTAIADVVAELVG